METDGWRVAGVSVAGPSHLLDGGECQDAHSIALDADGLVVALVSDGAGSTAHGGLAARFLCEHLTPLLRRAARIDGELRPFDEASRPRLSRRISTAIGTARRGLLAFSRKHGIDPDELLATLVGAIAHPRLGAVFFHVGDGAAICFDSEGEATLFSSPENGEYVNTTYFVIENHWKSHLRLSFQPPGFDSIFLMSDGVTDLSFTRGTSGMQPFRPFFDPLRCFLRTCTRADAEAALKASLDAEAARSKSDDDKSLVWIGSSVSNG